MKNQMPVRNEKPPIKRTYALYLLAAGALILGISTVADAISGSGTANYYAFWYNNTTLTNQSLYEVNGTVYLQGKFNATTVNTTNLCISGDCKTSWPLTNNANASANNSVNNIPVHTGGGNYTNTLLYIDKGLLGFNTTQPNASINVVGTLPALRLEGTTSSRYVQLEWQTTSDSARIIRSSSGCALNRGIQFIPTSSSPVTFFLDCNERVGVNNTNPNATIDVSGDARILKSVTTGKYYGLGATTVVAGDGSGTTPTVAIQGNDAHGLVNLTTGTLPVGGGNVYNVTFSSAYSSQPYCVLNPANNNAAALSGVTMVRIDYATSSTSKFVVTAGGTGLAGATAYQWVYHCGG